MLTLVSLACGHPDLKQLYKNYGNTDYIGEDISILHHSLQAAHIAYYEYNSVLLARAAFLHDIGHLLVFLKDVNNLTKLDKYGGNYHHEYDGYQFINENYNYDIEKYLILNHAKAKRYLVSKYSGYYDSLSESSKHTFKYNQGAYMTKAEMIEFENNKYFMLSVLLRRIDDHSKNSYVHNLWDLDTAFDLIF